MSKALWKLIQLAYCSVIRPVLAKAIDNPDSDLDDLALEALDRLFNCNGES